MSGAQVPVVGNWSSSTHSVTVKWKNPVDEQIEHYEVKYKINKPEKTFMLLNRDIKGTNFAEINDLDAGTEYLIKVYLVYENGDSKFYEEYKCTTKPRTDSDLKKNSMKLEYGFYKVTPFKVNNLQNDELREIQMISAYSPVGFKDYSLGEKTILILGATGSGKTTIVDALFNFVADVSFTDGYLYRLVDLSQVETELSKSQVQSQTSGVTIYRIPRKSGFKINYRLNIIDTPGFDDTRGKTFDKQIVQLIQQLFSKVIEHLDAVCIIVPLNAARLTDAQMYVFNSILELFGDNIKHNIIPFITYHDGGEDTHCKESLKAAGIQFDKSYTFNNSDFAKPPRKKENWDQRISNFMDFFNNLETMQKQCLKTSAEVIETRTELIIHIEKLKTDIRRQVQTVINMKNAKTAMKSYTTNKDVKVQLKFQNCESYFIKTRRFRDSLNCSKCEQTCHKNCLVPFQGLKGTCEIIKNGTCKACKCDKSDHKLETVYYELKFKDGKGNFNNVEQCCKNLEKSIKVLEVMFKTVQSCITTLHKIALKPEERTIKTFVDEIIKKEKSRKECGYEQRIEMLDLLVTNLAAKRSLENWFSEILQL